jgi:hypothetical protein
VKSAVRASSGRLTKNGLSIGGMPSFGGPPEITSPSGAAQRAKSVSG